LGYSWYTTPAVENHYEDIIRNLLRVSLGLDVSNYHNIKRTDDHLPDSLVIAKNVFADVQKDPPLQFITIKDDPAKYTTWIKDIIKIVNETAGRMTSSGLDVADGDVAASADAGIAILEGVIRDSKNFTMPFSVKSMFQGLAVVSVLLMYHVAFFNNDDITNPKEETKQHMNSVMVNSFVAIAAFKYLDNQ